MPERGNSSTPYTKSDRELQNSLTTGHRERIHSPTPHPASGRNSVVECLLPKQNVVGSIPIARSRNSSLPAQERGKLTPNHIQA